MGANGNPTGGSHNGPREGPSSSVPGGGQSGGGAASTAAATLATEKALRHNPGISITWSADEQAILEEGLSRHTSESAVTRFAKVALKLPGKTVREIALRTKWMAQRKESSKKRKEDHNLARKGKDKKEKADPSSKSSSHVVAQPNAPSYPLPMLPMDDDDISFKSIGGQTGDLLERNAQTLTQISTNLSNMQIQDNISLFCRTRDNILAVMKGMNDVPEIMKQMPPLPVKINEDLANSLLPSSAPVQ